jgi:hypothetical protein
MLAASCGDEALAKNEAAAAIDRIATSIPPSCVSLRLSPTRLDVAG